MVRHRTIRMKGALSQDTARLMVFKLVMAAAKTWRRLKGQNPLPKVVNGVKFKDRIEVVSEIKSTADSRRHPKSCIAHPDPRRLFVKIMYHTIHKLFSENKCLAQV